MKVSNPLTIIAIFAGVAETLATVALVQLPPEIQSVFVYFVMAFPAGIVLLFFCVLFFKNTVLYAPSDFENQNHYLETNQIKENINQELDEIFTRLNAGGVRLTQTEIADAKSSLEKAVDEIKILSNGDKDFLDFIADNEPTVTEICKYFKITDISAFKLLYSMESKGLIQQEGRNWCLNI